MRRRRKVSGREREKGDGFGERRVIGWFVGKSERCRISKRLC